MIDSTPTIMVVDLNGVVVWDNPEEISERLAKLFRSLPVRIYIVSGKWLEWCWKIGRLIGAEGVFAENATVFQKEGGQATVLAPQDDIEAFKTTLQFQVIEGLRSTIRIDGRTCPILSGPGRRATLSFGTNVMEGVRIQGCLWTPDLLCNKLKTLIDSRGFRLEILGPYPDGVWDIQPLTPGGSVWGKKVAVDILEKMFPSSLKVGMIDGLNDIGLAEHPRMDHLVTFKNGHETIKRIVGQRGGWVLKKNGPDGGIVTALRRVKSMLRAQEVGQKG